MRHTIRGIALAGLMLVPLSAVSARAQSPTPEGTVIKNKATVSWTDANNNTYASVSDSVMVTVGFAAGVDAQGTSPVTPTAGTTGNEQTYTIVNNGNGTDQFSVSTTAGSGITVTGYKIGSTPYATLAALNTALASTNVAAAGNVQVIVVYSVAAGAGGTSTSLALTGTSVRTNTVSDTYTTAINPTIPLGVTVTPDAGTASRLPSNGTQYTEQFTVTNTGGASATFNLAASTNNGAVLSIVSVNGTAGSSGSVTVAAGASQTVDVVYTIANGAAAGATASLQLGATHSTDGSVTDGGSFTITVIRAAVSMTVQAYMDDGTTLVSGNVVPGQYIRYKITVTNNGASAASNVSVSDPLPAEVTYQSTSEDAAGWTISEASGTVTASLASLAPAGSRFFWIRVRIK
ncbi:MAG TPA: hypothetical protein VHG28_07205 [Longimicrobiaceae bacterium]|nr:hypothetical protein [Longimicrobiaceae bacterium]